MEVRRIVANLDQTNLEETTLLADDEQIVTRLLATQGLPANARAALERIGALRQDLATRRGEVARLRKEQDDIERDQERLRRNLGAVPAGDALHRRLLGQLDADETRLATLRQSMEQASLGAERAQKALADAVANLKI